MNVFITRKEGRVFTFMLFILSVSQLFAQRNFTIIGLPDTQYYTDIRHGGTPAHFTAQTQWIADNKDSLNIVFVAHLGDVVQKGNTKENICTNHYYCPMGKIKYFSSSKNKNYS